MITSGHIGLRVVRIAGNQQENSMESDMEVASSGGFQGLGFPSMWVEEQQV